jgi:CheY-like chemotaxis protein
MRTVYMVDDSREVRERLITMITGLEGTFLAGATREPKEAVKTIRLLHPDAVILDIPMPGMSGIQVLKGIKEELRAPVAIMLANYPFGQYRRECAQAGAD